MASPTVLPYPVRTLTTPGGKPASLMRWYIRMAVRGVNSEGFRTMALPVVRAGPSFQDIMSTIWVGGEEFPGNNLADDTDGLVAIGYSRSNQPHQHF
ncbi:hypothetical protein BS17DRAFT_762734 [Gyrodon lividus]|nr:hypothetical protein BS17DRAFT_762734 [Gyrodon lividus]